MLKYEISLTPDGRTVLIAVPFTEDMLRDALAQWPGSASLDSAIRNAVSRAVDSIDAHRVIAEKVSGLVAEYLRTLDMSQVVRATAEKQAKRILSSELAKAIMDTPSR